MKPLKILIGIVVGYVALVVVFESLIGFFQPEAGEVLVITTFEDDGTPHDRVVSRLEHDGKLYVAANHWPRAWYDRALEAPDVHVRVDGVTTPRVAVPVGDLEYARVAQAHPLPGAFRFVTGFPQRKLLRLDPAPEQPDRPKAKS